jgi:hypothetical protein
MSSVCISFGAHLSLRGFGPCGIMSINVCYYHCHGNTDKAFCDIRDNNYEDVRLQIYISRHSLRVVY